MDESGRDELHHEIVFTTRSVDGDSEAVVTLQEHKDPTKPPFLIDVSKRPLEQQLSYCPPEQRKTHVIISTGSGDRCADDFMERKWSKG
jgi:hypothetical protein